LESTQTCCIFVEEFFLGVSIRISSVSLVFSNLFQCYSASRSETVRPKPSISTQRVASHDRAKLLLLLRGALPGGRKAPSGVIICFANMLLLSFIKGNSGCNPRKMLKGFHPIILSLGKRCSSSTLLGELEGPPKNFLTPSVQAPSRSLSKQASCTRDMLLVLGFIAPARVSSSVFDP
jgi:hypothetical protein